MLRERTELKADHVCAGWAIHLGPFIGVKSRFSIVAVASAWKAISIRDGRQQKLKIRTFYYSFRLPMRMSSINH